MMKRKTFIITRCLYGSVSSALASKTEHCWFDSISRLIDRFQTFDGFSVHQPTEYLTPSTGVGVVKNGLDEVLATLPPTKVI